MTKVFDNFINEKVFKEIYTLYSLKPQEIGSVLVESLSSYIARLAFEHNVPVRVLMKKVIIPQTNLKYLNKEYKHGHTNIRVEELSSKNLITREIVRAVEKLNGITNLEALTLLPLGDLIGKSKINIKYKKWCPNCLVSMKKIVMG